jgi:hypothetical protein
MPVPGVHFVVSIVTIVGIAAEVPDVCAYAIPHEIVRIAARAKCQIRMCNLRYEGSTA